MSSWNDILVSIDMTFFLMLLLALELKPSDLNKVEKLLKENAEDKWKIKR